MGESGCLLRSFSQPSETSREVFEGGNGNPIRALTESISFGRFMTESLDWEKWSMFSQNRYIEEASKFSKPGSVAQKKAFFEAHFKKRAAMKAASIVETGNIAVTNVVLEVSENKTNIDTLPSMDDTEPVASALQENVTQKESSMDLELTEPNVVLDEQKPKDIEVIYCSVVNNQTCDPTFVVDNGTRAERVEPEAVTEENVDVERSSLVESYEQLENGDSTKNVVAVVGLEEKVLNKEKSTSSIKTRQSKSPLTSSSDNRRIPEITSSSSRDKRATSIQPKNVITDSASKTDKSRGDEKCRPNAKSVHMSISFGSSTGENRKPSIKSSKDSVKSSKDCTIPPRAGIANTKKSTRVPNSRNGSMYNSLHMSIDLTTRKMAVNSLNTRQQTTSLHRTNKTSNVTSNRTTTVVGDSDIKKRSIANSLHMSIDLCSSSRGDKRSEPSLKMSENVSCRVQMSIQASSSSARLLKRPPVNLQSEEKRSNSLVKKEVVERTKTVQKSRSSTDDMKSLNLSRGRTGSSTSSHLRFRSEGATKRSKAVMKSGDEKAATDVNEVKPVTRTQPPKVSSTQITRPPSPRFGGKPSSDKSSSALLRKPSSDKSSSALLRKPTSDRSSSALIRKPSVDTGNKENNNNQRTTRSSSSLPKKNSEEKNTQTTTRSSISTSRMNSQQNNIKKSTGLTSSSLPKKTVEKNEIKSSTRLTTSNKSSTLDKNMKRPIRPTTSLSKKNTPENNNNNNIKIPTTRPTATISKRTASEKNVKSSIRPTSSLSKNSINGRNNNIMDSSSKKNEHENASPNILN